MNSLKLQSILVILLLNFMDLSFVSSSLYTSLKGKSSKYQNQTIVDEYDYVIVGGSSISKRIADRMADISEWRILLVEAGNEDKSDSDNLIPDFSEFQLPPFDTPDRWFNSLSLGLKSSMKYVEMARQSVNNIYSELFKKQLTNLTVVNDALVTRLIVEDQTAIGVEYIVDGLNKRANAVREVILSAGAIPSAQLLMLAGIGPEKILSKVGISIVADLPVGQSFQDYLTTVLFFETQYVSTFAQTMLQTPTLFTIFGAIQSVPIYPAEYSYHNFQNNATYLTTFAEDIELNVKILNELYERIKRNEISAILVTSKTLMHETLSLKSQSIRDDPEISIDRLDYDRAKREVISGIKQQINVINTGSFRSLGFIRFDSLNCGKYDTDDYWNCYLKYFTVPTWKPFGTIKMGTDSNPLAVVDFQSHVKGIYKLRVIDEGVTSDIENYISLPEMVRTEAGASLIKAEYAISKYFPF